MNDLRAYVRDNYYLDIKFVGSDIEQEVLLLDAIIHSGSTIIRAVSELGEHGKYC